MIWLFVAVVWFGCGYLTVGYWYGYVMARFPDADADCRRMLVVQLLLGPVGLIPILIVPRWRQHGRLYPWRSTRWIR